MAGENKFTSVPQEVDNLLSLTDLDVKLFLSDFETFSDFRISYV